MSAFALLLALWLGAWGTPPPAEDDQLVPRLMTLSQAILWYECQCPTEPIYESWHFPNLHGVWVGASTVEEGSAAGFWFDGHTVVFEHHAP